MKAITHFTARERKTIGEINNRPSETIPDQAVTPQELLRRYATGQPLGFKNVSPVYDDDEENPIPELYKMDKLDRLHALQNSSENLKEKRSDYIDAINKQKAEQAKKQAEQAKKEKDNTSQGKEQQDERSEDA